MKRLITLAGLLMLMISAFAQTPLIVSGVVMDQTTMQPVPNVTVYISEIGGTYSDSAVTNAQGLYVDSTTVIGGRQTGFEAALIDCNGNRVTNRGFANPMLPRVTINLVYCQRVAPCRANFTYRISALGAAIQFSGNAGGGVAPYSYSWDFGDGNTSTQQNPNHAYNAPGTYRVCLVITDANSCSDTTCQQVRIGNPNPNCQASFRTQAAAGNSVQFTDFSTPAPNPGSGVTASWQWDFGDNNSSTSQSPMHTYSAAGTYRVCLIYTLSGQGQVICSDTTCQPVRVGNPNPTQCQAYFQYRVRQNGWVQFAAMVRPNSSNTSATSVKWNFGDGTGWNDTMMNTRYQYTQSGVYNVCLAMSYQASPMGPVCTDTVCRRVRVVVANPTPCVAQFTHRQTAAGVSHFWALRANSPSSANHTYSWDFGDGNTGSGRRVQHTYAQNGTYNVCLIVDCGGGNADTTCRRIVIGRPQIQPSIAGQIRVNRNQPADSAVVYLIALDTQAGTLTAVDSTYTTPNGAYSFNNLNPGDYRIKAALQPSHPLYARRIPTYHTNSLHWSFANVITVNTNPAIANILLIAGNNPGGPGFVGGLISQGANKKGDPMPGVLLILTDENDVPYEYTLTNQDGEYTFGNLPYGTYRVYIEVIGKDYLYQTVSITEGSTTVDNVNFEINEEFLTTSVDDIIIDGGFGIAPNPASSELNVSFELKEASSYEIRVYNMVGQTVLRQQGASSLGKQRAKLDINALPNGIYTVQLSAGEQQLSKKLIVVK
jgi:PKD repeat protein